MDETLDCLLLSGTVVGEVCWVEVQIPSHGEIINDLGGGGAYSDFDQPCTCHNYYNQPISDPGFLTEHVRRKKFRRTIINGLSLKIAKYYHHQGGEHWSYAFTG